MNVSSNNNNDNWSYKDNKTLYISGGLALSSLMYYGMSWIISKFRRVGLNLWLEEYLTEIKDEFREVKARNAYNVGFVASCMNVVGEIQSHLYSQENEDLEKERKANYGDPKNYENLVMETIENHEKYFPIAADILYKKTGIDLEAIKDHMQKVDQIEFRLAMVNDKKPYYDSDLPVLDKIKLKEVYIKYAKTFIQHSRITQEQMAIMQRRPEYQEIAFKTIFQNKFLLKDMIEIEYGVDTKYLNQMVVKEKLLEDSEVSYYYEDVKRANSSGI